MLLALPLIYGTTVANTKGTICIEEVSERMDSAEIALRLAVAIIEKMPITRADASAKSTGEAVGELYITALQKVTQGLKDAGLLKSS